MALITCILHLTIIPSIAILWPMNSVGILAALLIFTVLLNLPFGYLRARSRKYSVPWFLYIHIPIPFIIFLRLTYGFNWKAIPLMVAAALAGQLAGGRIRQK